MTTHEKEAILTYLEFALTNMVDALDREKIICGQPQVKAVYDAAYDVLNDIETTLNDHLELCQLEHVQCQQ